MPDVICNPNKNNSNNIYKCQFFKDNTNEESITRITTNSMYTTEEATSAITNTLPTTMSTTITATTTTTQLVTSTLQNIIVGSLSSSFYTNNLITQNNKKVESANFLNNSGAKYFCFNFKCVMPTYIIKYVQTCNGVGRVNKSVT